VARGYTKAIARARDLIYVEDQYLWGHDIARVFKPALERNPDLHLVAVLPLETDLGGTFSRVPQLLGRDRAMRELFDTAPGRVAIYGLENERGLPIYVHAKVCVVDDTWFTIGSDNFNERSWTHDSELTAAVVEPGGRSGLARDLRMRLAAEHLGRLGADDQVPDMSDCGSGAHFFRAFAESAQELDDWYAGGREGPRPSGRLRLLELPPLSRWQRLWASVPLDTVHDPDGRPRPLRRRRAY
jgi:phosphatidylserine/phosphatidylglycerophosphate/cardiolipin synthase-like enzyme